MSLTAWVGTVAAFCTTVAFVPQIVKLRKQGGRGLSYAMLFLYLTGVLLWLAYGIRIHAVAMMWANGVAAVLVLISIVLKANPPANQLNPASRRLRIAVDMDEVIADAFGKHLSQYNQRAGANLTAEMISKSGLAALLPDESRADFNAIPHAPGFFADLEVIAGSQEALLELSRHHDIYITSAAMEVPSSFADKFQWMEKHFPFIPPGRIVFCGEKNIVNADVLIDDRSRHFKGFRGTGILFTAPHNATEAAELRANNWSEVLQILQGGRPESAGAEQLSRTLSMNPAG
ncbi:MAG: 5' nucleotidase, NT5C type [Terriglobales bacterium]